MTSSAHSAPRWELSAEAERILRAKYDGKRSTAEAIAIEIAMPTYKVLEWAELLGLSNAEQPRGPITPSTSKPASTPAKPTPSPNTLKASRTCAVCGKTYYPTYHTQQSCSRACGALLRVQRSQNTVQPLRAIETATPAPEPEPITEPEPVSETTPEPAQLPVTPYAAVAPIVGARDYDEVTVRLDANLALLMRLLLLLPTEQRVWKSKQRKRWLDAFCAAVDLVIEEIDEGSEA